MRRILDVGCGDMLLARLLPPGAHVDGVDPSAAARAAARAALPGVAVVGSLDDVPLHAYDAVVAHSVLQYLDGQDAVLAWCRDAVDRLRPDAPGGVVITDLPVPGVARAHDGVDLATHLSRRIGPWRAAREVVRAARRGPGGLLEVDVAALVGDATSAGIDARRLERNLSPFRHRATVVLDPP